MLYKNLQREQAGCGQPYHLHLGLVESKPALTWSLVKTCKESQSHPDGRLGTNRSEKKSFLKN